MTQMPPSQPAPGAPPAGAPGAAPGGVKPHRGVLILILGIAGIVCCVIVGIVAWVLGNKDLAEMAAGRMDRAGEGLTKAGKICGMISVILWIIMIVLNIIFGGFAAVMSSMSQ